MSAPANAQQGQFRLQEALTCAQLTRLYLDRIAAYNMQGPALRAIITVNPKAMETAAEMDRSYRASPATVGAAALHPSHPQRQLQYVRHAHDRRQRQHEVLAAPRRRLYGCSHTQGGSADPGEGEPAGVRARGHVDIEPRRSGAQPLRPYPHPRWLQRRHRRVDRFQFRGAGHGQRQPASRYVLPRLPTTSLVSVRPAASSAGAALFPTA
jgi:hypothetical protein